MSVANAPGRALHGALHRPVQILHVEDSPSDVALTAAALSQGSVATELHVAKDGVEALAFLHRQGVYSDAPRPDLILLDLNLPKKDGRQVLADVKTDVNLRPIPVVILTSSAAPDDISKAYQLYANAYVTKPVGYDEFLLAMRQIEGTWLTLVALPR